jgi:TolA-binding protein
MKVAVRFARPFKSVALAAVALALVMPAVPALSQDTLAEARIRKMEAEIRVLQRKIFPGEDGRFFQPEIAQADPASTASATGQPASSAVTDLLTRMDTLESRMARLTAQIEENSNRLSQLEANTPAARRAATPAASEDPANPPAEDAPTTEPVSAQQANLNAMSGGASKPPIAATASTTSGPPAERVSAVSAVVKPQTEDSADDEYTYGFRLWDANFHPEAQQQLKLFLDKNPTHWRATWARNLLGRAYLDGGNPREAAKWFIQNYQADKTAARAPDSLLYLAATMKQLDDTNRACIALAEFSETFAAEAAGRLNGLYETTRNGLDCSG